MKLSVCLIVKNEETMLRQCLESVNGADEIVVVDTGSADKTIGIALQFTDKVFTDYIWNDNFPEARNHAKSKATGDWILSIDADEILASGGISKIRKIIANTPEKAFYVNMTDNRSFHKHQMIRLFKNDPDVFWEVPGGGYVHESINTPGLHSPVSIFYDYSPAHNLDPHIDNRLLLKSVKDFPHNPRNYYYLGREYYYRQDFFTAIAILEKYISMSSFPAEKADAWLMIARCLWFTHQGEKARQACFNAISINASFKEAVLFMAEMSWEHNADVWKKFAANCDNTGVVFIRT